MSRQEEDVIKAMERLGGYATFSALNYKIDFSTWKTKTPDASVRRIVQQSKNFFRIQPGLWGLISQKNSILNKLGVEESEIIKGTETDFSHYYFQGLLVEIGNMKNLKTYIPPQDKNRNYLEKKLSEVATIDKIFPFTYENIVNKAKTVDTIWFNERDLPDSFFEVEHSTDIKNSLGKFFELQDFNAKFYIVADTMRRRQFDDAISASMYNPIKNIVKFIDYEAIVVQYNKMYDFTHNMVI